MSESYLISETPSPGLNDDQVAGMALAEAVITCRAVETDVDELKTVVRDLILVVSDLQSRIESLESPAVRAATG